MRNRQPSRARAGAPGCPEVGGGRLALVPGPYREAGPTRLRLEVDAAPGPVDRVLWFVDDRLAAVTTGPSWLWPVEPGVHAVRARVQHRTGWSSVGPLRFRLRLGAPRGGGPDAP